MSAARELDAGRELLDHQMIDHEGRLCGKVDDVELEVPVEGGLPVVTALLVGPGVLAARVRGRLAAGLGELHRRLHPDADGPVRVPMDCVAEIASAVRLSVASDELDSYAFEGWFADHVISRIPGADHAVE
ncbi:MAG: hypothetical protein ACR2LQ_12775 [Acidimicrobiales bacterium]